MKKILLLIPFFCIFFTALADDAVFQRPSTKNLVVDKANALTDWEVESLTAKLDSLDMATSTQIQIYTTTDLQGYAIADFGQRLGEGWGVGQAGFDNGIVIVYKPKTETEKGEVTIQTGYGIEPLIPDAICKRIIENEMIPCFRQDSVYEGFVRAVDACISLTKGEFTADDYYEYTESDYSQKSDSSYDDLETRDYIVVICFFVFLIVSVILSTKYANKHPGRVKPGHSGSYGGRRSGGYGGGHFGGGGASGSW